MKTHEEFTAAVMEKSRAAIKRRKMITRTSLAVLGAVLVCTVGIRAATLPDDVPMGEGSGSVTDATVTTGDANAPTTPNDENNNYGETDPSSPPTNEAKLPTTGECGAPVLPEGGPTPPGATPPESTAGVYTLTVRDCGILLTELKDSYTAGDTVTFRTEIIYGAKIICTVNGKELAYDVSESETQAALEFSFEMPEGNAVLVIKTAGADE